MNLSMQELNDNTQISLPSGSFDYEVTGSDRVLNVLVRQMEEMRVELHTLKTQKILDETHLPIDVLSQNGLLPVKPRKLKRGKGHRPLLQSEIEEAIKHSPFAAGQARWLGVATSTLKKYAQLYGIYKPTPNVKGFKHNIYDPNRGKFHLDDILEGKYPDIADWTVKDKLIRSGKVPAKCNICGYDRRRITDQKICLLLDHKDGDRKNFKLENLQLLCLNCTHECGRGYIRRGNHLFDADWIQGADTDEISKVKRW
jgi:hypothetical protein